MKKNYIMGVIACAALTMTSCSNDEIGGNNTKQGGPTKAEVSLVWLLGRGYNVRKGGKR